MKILVLKKLRIIKDFIISKTHSSKSRVENLARIETYLQRIIDGESIDISFYRWYQLREILKYAYEHIEYYRCLFDQYSLDLENLTNFSDLPTLDKCIVRSYRYKLISDEINKMHSYQMNTGGSTGEPLEFVVSSNAGRVDAMHQYFQYKLMGFKDGDSIAAFDGSNVPEVARKKGILWAERKSQLPYGKIHYSSLYLTPDTIDQYINHIIETQPAILRGYPSFINTLAEYILSNKISLRYLPKGVELTSENVFQSQINNIRNAFGPNIWLQYGHSEVCVFGYATAKSGKYLCSPLYGFVEVLDAQGKQVAYGEIGEVVATSFHNHAMPFIRYRTGDVAVYGGISDGFVILNSLIGRSQDYVFTKDNEKIALTGPIFGQHISAFRSIRKWQFIQDIPGKLKVRIVKEDSFSKQDEEEIFDALCRIGMNKLEFEYVDQIELTDRGKYKFLIQNIKDNN